MDEGQRKGDQLLMSVDPDVELSEEEPVTVRFDRANLHLFDRQSGDARCHGLVSSRSIATDEQRTTVED